MEGREWMQPTGWLQTQLKSERRWKIWVRTVSLCHTYHPASEKGNWGTWPFPRLPKTGRRADETSPTTSELYRPSAEPTLGLGSESIFTTVVQMSWFLLGNDFHSFNNNIGNASMVPWWYSRETNWSLSSETEFKETFREGKKLKQSLELRKKKLFDFY